MCMRRSLVKILAGLLLNALVSFGISLGVLYWAPGYAANPQEVADAINTNAKTLSAVIKTLNQLTERASRK